MRAPESTVTVLVVSLAMVVSTCLFYACLGLSLDGFLSKPGPKLSNRHKNPNFICFLDSKVSIFLLKIIPSRPDDFDEKKNLNFFYPNIS